MATKKASTSAKKSTMPTAEEEAPKAVAKKAPAKTATKKSQSEGSAVDTKPTETKAASKKKASHDEIARHAHSLWEKSGHHHGSHVDNWLKAEKELNG